MPEILVLFFACQASAPRHALVLPPVPTGSVTEAAPTPTGAVPHGRDANLNPTGDGKLPEPAWIVDVLVIGSGPAGLSAAWEARQSGADVLVLEAEPEAGGNGRFAGHLFAAGTDTQQKQCVDDSVELALSEWETFTAGGDPTDPAVQTFVESSYDNLLWLEETFGIRHEDLLGDMTVGSVPRVHGISPTGGGRPTDPFVAELADVIWTEKPALELVLDHGHVVGVWLDEADPQAWVRARATVVATGGFARNVERLLADRPELVETSYVYEIGHSTVGGGHELLETIGADFHNTGRYGIYVHAVRDWREGYENEALTLNSVMSSLIVDVEGNRLVNEQQTLGFQVYDTLLDSPGNTLYALFPQRVFRSGTASVPSYNMTPDGSSSKVAMTDLAAYGVTTLYASVSDLATGLGFDEATIEATIQRYDDQAAAGVDEDFGKDAEFLIPFASLELMAAPLAPGAAKSFGGVRTDERGRVLYPNGEKVPGLFAAGEVAGTLGTDAVGKGFSGSLAACYFMGRVAGEQAASYAAAIND